MRCLSLAVALVFVCLVGGARGEYFPESAFHASEQIARIRVSDVVVRSKSSDGVHFWNEGEIAADVLEMIKGEAVRSLTIGPSSMWGKR